MSTNNNSCSSSVNDPAVFILHSLSCEEQPQDIERMKKILQKDPSSLNRRCESDEEFIAFNTYPLHHAIYNSHLKCVEFLLENGANPDHYDSETHYNPLLLTLTALVGGNLGASQEIFENIIKLLLKHGASPNIPIEFGTNISRCKYLECAAKIDGYKVTEMLLDHGCQIEDFELDSNNKLIAVRCWGTPLRGAINFRNTKVIKLLLLNGASLCFYYNENMPPFSLAHAILVRYKSYIDKGNIDEVIGLLNALKLHGGNLWSVNRAESKDDNETLGNVLQCLQREIWFPRNLQLEQKVEELMITPISLQSQCRLSIKKVFGRNYVKNIQLLPLPKDIIKFLYYSDLE